MIIFHIWTSALRLENAKGGIEPAVAPYDGSCNKEEEWEV